MAPAGNYWRLEPPAEVRMAGSVCTVTVSFNSASDIRGLLDSLMAEGIAVSRVVVVDNASTDGTPEMICREYPNVSLVRNQKNMGFAAGANQGIAACEGEYVLLVNPDVRFQPGFVGALVAALDAGPKAGAAAPKLVRPEGGVIDSAGLSMRKDRKAVDRGSGERDQGQYGSPCRVFGASGAAALLRRAALEDAAVWGEVFDESFFAYKEDVDLAWRMALLGWEAVYVPGAVGIHARGWKVSSRRRVPRWLRTRSHANRYLTIIKNDDLPNIIIHLPHVIFLEAKLFIYAVMFEPFLFGAIRDIIANMRGALAKRAEIMKRRKLPPADMRRLFG